MDNTGQHKEMTGQLKDRTEQHSTWHYVALLTFYQGSIWLNQGSTLLYLTLLHSTLALFGSMWLYYPSLTLLHSIMYLLSCNSLTYTLPWPYLAIYLALLDCTLLFHGSAWLYLSLLHSTMALLGYTWLYFVYTMALLGSTWLYYTLEWVYLVLLTPTMAVLGFTWLYDTLPWLYLILPRLNFTLLDSSTLYYGSNLLY